MVCKARANIKRSKLRKQNKESRERKSRKKRKDQNLKANQVFFGWRQPEILKATATNKLYELFNYGQAMRSL